MLLWPAAHNARWQSYIIYLYWHSCTVLPLLTSSHCHSCVWWHLRVVYGSIFYVMVVGIHVFPRRSSHACNLRDSLSHYFQFRTHTFVQTHHARHDCQCRVNWWRPEKMRPEFLRSTQARFTACEWMGQLLVLLASPAEFVVSWFSSSMSHSTLFHFSCFRCTSRPELFSSPWMPI